MYYKEDVDMEYNGEYFYHIYDSEDVMICTVLGEDCADALLSHLNR